MAKSVDNMRDYEENWTNSYQKWQTNVQDKEDDYEQGLADFLNSDDDTNVSTNDFSGASSSWTDGVSGVSEGQWGDSAMSTEDWFDRFSDVESWSTE